MAGDAAGEFPIPPGAGDLGLSPERRAVLAPKLAALVAELAKMEELEGRELEPDTADPWGPDPDSEAAGDGR